MAAVHARTRRMTQRTTSLRDTLLSLFQPLFLVISGRRRQGQLPGCWMPPLDHQDRLTKDNDISQASIHSRCADSPTPLNVFYDLQVAAGRYKITRNRFAPGKGLWRAKHFTED